MLIHFKIHIKNFKKMKMKANPNRSFNIYFLSPMDDLAQLRGYTYLSLEITIIVDDYK